MGHFVHTIPITLEPHPQPPPAPPRKKNVGFHIFNIFFLRDNTEHWIEVNSQDRMVANGKPLPRKRNLKKEI